MAERKTYTAEDFKGCNGRRVLVEGVVAHANVSDYGNVVVEFAREDCSSPINAYVSPSAIVEILPEEIGVGDRVRTTGTGECRVLFIDGDDALVRYDDRSATAWLLSDLTLVERAG